MSNSRIGQPPAGADAPRLRSISLAAAADAIARGDLKARALADAQLACVEATDARIEAWAHLEPARVRAEADRCDAIGGPRGRLHGIGIGSKDIIATADEPTEMGSPIYAGHRPDSDAACVLPIGLAANGLPLGAQLAAPAGEDGRLLAVAAWCESCFGFQGLVDAMTVE